MFFDGDGRHKRKVDLGGRRVTPESKDTLLERAKAERERRIELKRDNAAAVVIQSSYRRHRDSLAARNRARAEWDALFTVSGGSAPIGAAATAEGVTSMIRGLNFFAVPHRDVERLVRTAAALASSLRAPVGCGRNVIELIHRGKDAAASLMLQMSEFASNCSLVMADPQSLGGGGAAVRLVLWVAECLSQERALDALLNGAGVTDHAAVAREIAVRVCRTLVERGALFATLARYFSTASAVGWPHLSSALALTMAPFSIRELKPVVAQRFVVEFATALAVPSIVCPQLNPVFEAGLCAAIPDFAVERVQSFTPRQSCVLFRNIRSISRVGEDIAAAVSTMYGTLFTAIRRHIDAASSGAGQLDSAVADTVAQLGQTGIVAAIFRSLELEPPPYDAAQSFCLLLDSVLMCPALAKHHAMVLGSVASGTDFVVLLWPVIAARLSVAVAAPATVQQSDRLLSFWAKAFLLSLATLDDEEFFAQQFFPLTTLTAMVGMLTQIVWRSVSTVSMHERFQRHQVRHEASHHDDDVRSALTALLQHLYDRNSRRQFCSPDTWVIRQIARKDIQASPSDPLNSAVLRTIPFVLPFADRIEVLHAAIRDDRYARPPAFVQAHHVSMRRQFLVEDGMANINVLGPSLKGHLRITFVDDDGITEAGIDGGGLFKELMTQLVQRMFDPQLGLFCATADRQLYPNPSSVLLTNERLEQYRFAGRLIGKCIYEEVLVELPLAKFFLAKMLGKGGYGSPLNDLVFLDPQLYRNLRALKTQDVTELDLFFSMPENDFGESVVTDLVPGGRDILVTNENKLEYIRAVADFKINARIRRQSQAFLSGLSDLINPDWLRLFNQDELQFVISGSPSGVDIVDWRRNTKYSGGFTDDSETVQLFWEVVSEFTPRQQADLLMFATSCSRPPLLGFSHLNPPFTIYQVTGVSDDHLPTAATCINLLKLPSYGSRTVLREKLILVIQSHAGFDLS